ncbi:MAG: hypothetical protein U0519_03335 [Candidatus Gracilibacteria bacterium]
MKLHKIFRPPVHLFMFGGVHGPVQVIQGMHGHKSFLFSHGDKSSNVWIALGKNIKR